MSEDSIDGDSDGTGGITDALSEAKGHIQSKAGLVAIVGRANVGKSRLVNQLVGEKISIVSPVAQTTRHSLRGIITEERGQLVFLDTPGVHKGVTDLSKIMNRAARRSTEGVDAILVVFDAAATAVREQDEGWMRRLAASESRFLFVLNKIDLGTENEARLRGVWSKVAAEKGVNPEREWLSVSAATGAGVPQLVSRVFELAPAGEPLFPEDTLTDFPLRWAIGDTIREKLFLELRDELPHAIAVKVGDIAETEGGWAIDALIYVNRASQKGILIGRNGGFLRKARLRAEAELSEIYERSVELNLWVKVEPGWSKNPRVLRELGYGD